MTRVLTTHGLRLDVGDAELLDLEAQGLIAEIEPKKKGAKSSKSPTEPSTETPPGVEDGSEAGLKPDKLDPEGGN